MHINRAKRHIPRAGVRRGKGEDGMALIAAVLATMVALTLSVTATALSLHNQSSSTNEVSHTQSIDAAEAGLDYAIQKIESNTTTSLPCSLSGSLSGTPAQSYQTTVTYYASYPPSGSPLGCPLTITPAGAVINSLGTTFSSQRTLEAQIQLTPVVGGFNYAVFVNGNATTNSNVNLVGHNGNDADLYAKGNWNCNSRQSIQGSVYVQDTATVNSNCTINGSLWAKNSVTLNSSDTIGVDLTSSTSSITMNSRDTVGRNVSAGTTCTGCSSNTIGGTISTNHPVSGPPVQTFPVINYNASDWQSAGYTIHTYSGSNACSSAQSDLATGFTTAAVVRVASTCTLIWNSGNTLTVKANLAIITDGPIIMNSNVHWTSTVSPTPSLEFIVPDSDASTCPTPSFTINSNVNFTGVNTLMYTPCNFTSNSNNGFTGQVLVGGLVLNSNMTISYYPVAIPGAGTITGFTANVAFEREIVNGSG